MEFILLLTCFLVFSGTAVVDGSGVAKIITKEDDNVIIPCSFGTTLTDKRIEWIKDNKEIYIVENGRVNPSRQDQQFRDRVSHFPDELKSGNASIKINKAEESDSGNYDCKYSNPGDFLPAGLNKIVLTVGKILKDRSREQQSGFNILFAIPSVRIVNQTDDGALLSCKVLGAHPEPTLVWYDRAGNNISNKAPQVSEKGERYDVILETTVTKTDYYTCVATQKKHFHQANETTFVNTRDPVKITTKEDDNVILPCSFDTTLTDKRIEWIKDNKEIYIVENGRVIPSRQDQQFRDRFSHFPDELESGNASIKINKAKESDRGSYDCKYSDPGKGIPSALNKIELTVETILMDRSGHKSDFNNRMAKPSVRTVGPTDDGVLLSCEVLGASSKPTVVWYDSAGNSVSDKAPLDIVKGNNDVILEIEVTKTDYYTCVATQEDIHHQSKITTYVIPRGKGISVTPSLVLIGITIGVLTGV